MSEVDLRPTRLNVPEDPLGMLAELCADEFTSFRSRDGLVQAYAGLLRQTGGIGALLASRVDLRPHQLQVAGRILLDTKRRYVLADEVGLGKTIEAGIVIYDLLSQRPDARVLIIAPGALTQQWLCELYSKFSRQPFALLDLHAPSRARVDGARTAIISSTLAVGEWADPLARAAWDMVVVDEVHQLLASPTLYAFVRDLARRVELLLLLSAMPAQRRADEFLKLLALLEPERYHPDPARNPIEFHRLYEAQPEIGRRVSMLLSRVNEVALAPKRQEASGAAGVDGEDEDARYTRADVVDAAKRLVRSAVVNEDAALVARAEAMTEESPTLLDDARALTRDVVDRFRVNRRILRNRRAALIDEEQITPIERACLIHGYEPRQVELDALQSLATLLEGAWASATAEGAGGAASAEPVLCLTRTLWHAAALPATLEAALLRLSAAEPKRRARHAAPAEGELLATGGAVGAGELDAYFDHVAQIARPHVSDGALNAALARVAAWRQAGVPTRLAQLVQLLKTMRADEPACKVLVFAGTPGAAAIVACHLKEAFHKDVVAEFRSELAAREKEAEVRRFRRRSGGAWVLVSDETGGEGRNFQFASALVHVDTPWHPARVEQRIGRLDRLGRERFRSDVTSHVLTAVGGVEAGVVRCYLDGLNVYGRSISGLEFALRDVERQLITHSLGNGSAGEGLLAYVPALAELAEAERARDETEVLLGDSIAANGDLTGAPSAAAAPFAGLRRDVGLENNLERKFLNYVRGISGDRKTQAVDDDDFPGLVWRFAPSNVIRGNLQLKPNAGGLLEDVTGTFRREAAQQRPDLEFFTVGNPWFDAVIQAALGQRFGRSYAVECLSPQHANLFNPWHGLEFVFYASPDLSAIGENVGLRNRAARPFQMRRVNLFYRLDGTLEQRGDALRKIRTGLGFDQRGQAWWDLSGKGSLAVRALAEDWHAAVTRAYAAAVVAARAALAAQLDAEVAAEEARIDWAVEQLGQRARATDDEAAALNSVKAAILGWSPCIDSTGFLSVNGTVRA